MCSREELQQTATEQSCTPLVVDFLNNCFSHLQKGWFEMNFFLWIDLLLL